MESFPAVLTHNYHPDHGCFRNICELPEQEARGIFEDLRASGLRRIGPAYLQRRLAAEGWLRRESRRLIKGARLAHPLYFFLGDFADGLDPARPRSIVMPLTCFPRETITFTYGDSMTVFRSARQEATSAPHDLGRVCTLAAIEEIVARNGLPERLWPRRSSATGQGFVEVQVWDDAPILAFFGVSWPHAPICGGDCHAYLARPDKRIKVTSS